VTSPCPKCGYVRQTSDHSTMTGICPQCGIAVDKWLSRQEGNNQLHATRHKPVVKAARLSLVQKLQQQFLALPQDINTTDIYSRAALLAIFALWGASFILGGIDWQSIGGSFLHNAILPFHEFGHVLFSPFGRFMAILGGSLFQVLMPLGLMLAFSIQRCDNFAAAIMLWWCGQSFIDLSPYIADAPYRAIPLIRGMGEAAHDWGNLLTMTDSLGSAQGIAQTAFLIGSILMTSAIVWGGYLLWQQYKQLDLHK